MNFTHFSKCAWHSSSKQPEHKSTRWNPVGKRINHLKGSVEVKKSVVPTLLLRRGRKKEGRGRSEDIVAWFSHIFARRRGKTIFTHIFLVNPGVIILIKKMLNIFSKLKRNIIRLKLWFYCKYNRHRLKA
jgi:hypothetical protein